MAYNANNEIREELAKIQKNDRGEFVVATKITNKNSGNVSIDIRQNYTNADGEVMPTSKGVRFNAENLVELLEGLVKGLESNEMVDLADKLNDLADLGDMDADTPEE